MNSYVLDTTKVCSSLTFLMVFSSPLILLYCLRHQSICLDISPNIDVLQDILLQPAGFVPFFHPLWFFIFVFKYLIILFLGNIFVPKFDLDLEVARRNCVAYSNSQIPAWYVGMWRTIHSLEVYLQNCWVFQILGAVDFFVLPFIYIYIYVQVKLLVNGLTPLLGSQFICYGGCTSILQWEVP